MAEEMAAQGWASLPADLVNRVADCLLATNDLDFYTDLRAVCQHWRSVTADPRSNQHDPRFRPSRWVLLDEHKASSSAAVHGALLFVNTATGRFLRRTLPLLRDPAGHAFVTSTTGGLLVLAATDPPHAVSVLNPFTGSLIRFAAPLPSVPRPRLRLTADVVVGPSPALVLVSVGRSFVCCAAPQSESFSIEKSHRNCPASRLPQIIAAGGKCSAAANRESVPAGANNIFDQLRSEEYDKDCRCYTVVATGGDMLLAVLKRRRGMDVFKIDASGNVKERVDSIGSLALFLGVRCLVVDAHCFPTVEPNCAYFQLRELTGLDDQPYIFKFSIGTCGNEEDEPELVSAAMAIGNDCTVSPCNTGPFTVTQLLSNYTMDIPGEQLMWKGWYSCLELVSYIGGDDHYTDYIDYVDDDDDESDDDDWGSNCDPDDDWSSS
jgi:hypothetical protein